MAENTSVGPAGGNKPAMPSVKPVNHNTSAKDGRDGAAGLSQATKSGPDSDSGRLSKVGPIKLGGELG